MSCNGCDDRIRKFPQELQCFLWDYTVTYPKPFLGFAGKTSVLIKPTIAVNSITIDIVNHPLFLIWYIQELNYGSLPFLLDLKLYGVQKEWLVEFDNSLEITEKITQSNLYEVDFKFKIVEDISDSVQKETLKNCKGCSNE